MDQLNVVPSASLAGPLALGLSALNIKRHTWNYNALTIIVTYK